jgi:hypothetical protein
MQAWAHDMSESNFYTVWLTCEDLHIIVGGLQITYMIAPHICMFLIHLTIIVRMCITRQSICMHPCATLITEHLLHACEDSLPHRGVPERRSANHVRTTVASCGVPTRQNMHDPPLAPMSPRPATLMTKSTAWPLASAF